MNKYEELTGTFVLVNPDLPNDTAGMQNHIGIITEVEIENDNIYVSFGKLGQGIYSADALLVLRKERPVYSFNEMDHITHIDTDNFVDILHVSMLAVSPSAKDRREAMEYAQYNDSIREYFMISLDEQLRTRQNYNMSR